MRRELSTIHFLIELARNWRQCLAQTAESGQYRPNDIDLIAARLREDFVRLPIFRFLQLDPVCIYRSNPHFFRWSQILCSSCKKQNECSLMATSARRMPAFEKYCANASFVHRHLSNSPVAAGLIDNRI